MRRRFMAAPTQEPQKKNKNQPKSPLSGRTGVSAEGFDIASIRADFPILNQQINGSNIINDGVNSGTNWSGKIINNFTTT